MGDPEGTAVSGPSVGATEVDGTCSKRRDATAACGRAVGRKTKTGGGGSMGNPVGNPVGEREGNSEGVVTGGRFGVATARGARTPGNGSIGKPVG